jgi:hypothetical protein
VILIKLDYEQTPLRDVAEALDVHVSDIADPHYDDPSLALLFAQLRSKTLQAAQGTSEISGRAEFHFVLQIARVFCRMGALFELIYDSTLQLFSWIQVVMYSPLTSSDHGRSSVHHPMRRNRPPKT